MRYFALVMLLLAQQNAFADYDPNDNYSSLVLSYQSTKFSTPICINSDCHTGVYGPAAVYARQIIPNLALGVSGTYLQSKGKDSSVLATSLAGFAQFVVGLGNRVDVGTSISLLGNSLRVCSGITNDCATYDDYGNILGVFGKVFLNDNKTLSATLGYDAVTLHNSPNQSVYTLALVAIVAKQHRFRVYIDRVNDSRGDPVSGGAGLGYSFIVF